MRVGTFLTLVSLVLSLIAIGLNAYVCGVRAGKAELEELEAEVRTKQAVVDELRRACGGIVERPRGEN